MVAMEFDQLLKAETLVKPRWRNVVVIMLDARGPTRFTELSRAITAYSGRPIADTRLTSTLNLLKKNGCVYREIGPDGHPYWRLTREGDNRAATLRGVGRAMTRSATGGTEPAGADDGEGAL